MSGGNESTATTFECRTASSQCRGPLLDVPGSVRSASVTGAPSASASGTNIDRIMCWTMCTLSSVVSYVEIPDEVATKNDPMPRITKEKVRPSGQWSPRLRRTSTPQM